MTTVAGAARTSTELRGNSRIAAGIYSDLMALDPAIRFQFASGLTVADLEQVFAYARVEAGTPYALYADDPVGFVEQVLGETTWSLQRAMLRAIVSHKRVAVPAGFSVSKCVPCNETMQLADGSVAQIQSLVGTTFHVLGWQEDGTQTVRRARASWNRFEPIYRVTTAGGRSIDRNGAHPLWTGVARVQQHTGSGSARSTGLLPEVRGWTPMEKIEVGDLVLVPERVRTVGDARWPAGHAALLGYLLGDGGTTADVRFSQMAGPAADEFVAIVESLGGRTVELTSKGRHREIAARCPVGSQTNPIMRLTREWGIQGCKATEKRLPAAAWRLHPDELAVIAGRLFSCDGTVSVRKERTDHGKTVTVNTAALTLCLVNEGLIRDFHRLMLRLGIAGTVGSRKGYWKGKEFDVWVWHAGGTNEIKRFAQLIDAPEKNDRVREAVEVATGRKFQKMWLHRNVPSGYRWEKVTEVDLLPERLTANVEVETDHAWVDLFVEHNTHSAARAVAFWASVTPPGTSLAVTTATRMRQVQRQLWPHIRQLVARAGLPGECDMTQWRMPGNDGYDVVVAYGFSAPPHDESAVQGVHALGSLLVVIDEAGGISRTIGKATRGLLAGEDAHLLAIGNPPTDDEQSWFESLCDDPTTHVVSIPATASPNLTGEVVGRCGACPREVPAHPLSRHLVDAEWVASAIREHGEDAPYVLAKVYARFPRGGSSRALPASWVDAAVEALEPDGTGVRPLRDLVSRDDPQHDSPRMVDVGSWVRLGVDVAADGGDEFVIARAVGDLMTIQHAAAGAVNANPHDVAGRILAEIRRAEHLRIALGCMSPVRVKVDAIGVGWGVAGILEAWGPDGERLHNAQIVRVVVSEGIDENRRRLPEAETLRPYRKRDEMWLAFRSLLAPEPDGTIALRLDIDRRTAAQLSAPTYGTSSTGRTVIESKKSLRERGISSPDRAEAVLLAVYEPAVRARRGRLLS